MGLVRSLYLDKTCYTPEIVTIFQKLGNFRVNEILEYVSDGAMKKPNSSDSRDVKQQFIQSKYQEKKLLSEDVLRNFVISDTPPFIHCASSYQETVKEWLQHGDVLRLFELLMMLLKRFSQEKVSWNDMLSMICQWIQQISAAGPIDPLSKRFLELNGILTDS